MGVLVKVLWFLVRLCVQDVGERKKMAFKNGQVQIVSARC